MFCRRRSIDVVDVDVVKVVGVKDVGVVEVEVEGICGRDVDVFDGGIVKILNLMTVCRTAGVAEEVVDIEVKLKVISQRNHTRGKDCRRRKQAMA